jgi:hypothetical protein
VATCLRGRIVCLYLPQELLAARQRGRLQLRPLVTFLQHLLRAAAAGQPAAPDAAAPLQAPADGPVAAQTERPWLSLRAALAAARQAQRRATGGEGGDVEAGGTGGEPGGSIRGEWPLRECPAVASADGISLHFEVPRMVLAGAGVMAGRDDERDRDARDAAAQPPPPPPLAPGAALSSHRVFLAALHLAHASNTRAAGARGAAGARVRLRSVARAEQIGATGCAGGEGGGGAGVEGLADVVVEVLVDA